MSEDASGANIENRNIAADDAHVDQQVGYAEVVVHYGNTYTVSAGDTVERKHEVARNNLVGGVPSRAEELFGELVFGGDHTTERIYYYVLSVLSGRGAHDLTEHRVAGLRNAWKLRANLPSDGWTAALGVVRSLFEDVRSNSSDGSFEAVAAFGELPRARQDEISMHLSQLLGGVIEQRLDAERKYEVDVERRSGNRSGRAWKFFEPDPAQPTPHEPRVTLPRVDERGPAAAGGGIAGLAFLLSLLGSPGPFWWIGILLLALGCVLVVRHGIEHTAHRLHIALLREGLGPRTDEQPARTAVDTLVERCFRDARPEDAQDWPQYAAGYRAQLKQRFDNRFAEDDRAGAKTLKWLFDWHAQRVAQKWLHGAPLVLAESPVPGVARRWQAVGVLAVVAGVVVLLGSQHWLVVPIVLGGWFALPAVMELIALRRTAALLHDDANALFAEEMAEYDRWCQVLVDRPDDGEMARWLALDKAHLKAEALRRASLTEQDLVSHVVISELAPFARRGAVPNGPPRYTAYQVTVMLLTKHGARVSRVNLDFLTGEHRNEGWYVFGYDRIASASLQVVERNVRASSGELVRRVRREFRLRLLDGAEIMRIKDSPGFRSDTDVDDESELELLAAATSGMDAALPVLEAAAHRGREWIEREYDRGNAHLPAWSD